MFFYSPLPQSYLICMLHIPQLGTVVKIFLKIVIITAGDAL